MGEIEKGTVMENDKGKGGKKESGKKDFCPFVCLICYFWCFPTEL